MKTKKQEPVIVYWLTLAKDERELFCDIVRILCKQFDAPSFEPHLTLVATAIDRLPPREVLQRINSAPIRLSVRGVAFSPHFAKSLFVRFEPSASLQRLVVDLGRATESRAKPPRDPHVSLLYNTLSPAVKKELAATIKLPFHEVAFDSISAVRSSSPIQTGADVEAWKVVETKSLRE